MSENNTLAKRKKMMFWTGIAMLLAIFLLPMTGYVSTGFANADQSVEVAKETNPRADYWRQVRDNSIGYSAVKGRETNELIQGSGESWRQLRNGPIAWGGSVLLIFTLAILMIFYAWRGKVELTHPKTGKTIERWTLNERRLHWATAGLFVVLGITGLSLLYGRAVLIPLFGHDGFSAYAGIAKWLHNIIGPMFMIGLILMIVNWFSQNFFTKVDLEWFKQFGGMVGDNHPSAGKLNGGEKVWFWTLATVGVVMCLSGLVLDFPNFDQEREIIQISHLLHVLTALVMVAFSFGHIYIGTIGTEGALEGMVTGQVDTAWAEQHHDLWAKDVENTKSEK